MGFLSKIVEEKMPNLSKLFDISNLSKLFDIYNKNNMND